MTFTLLTSLTHPRNMLILNSIIAFTSYPEKHLNVTSISCFQFLFFSAFFIIGDWKIRGMAILWFNWPFDIFSYFPHLFCYLMKSFPTTFITLLWVPAIIPQETHSSGFQNPADSIKVTSAPSESNCRSDSCVFEGTCFCAALEQIRGRFSYRYSVILSGDALRNCTGHCRCPGSLRKIKFTDSAYIS